MARFTEKMLQCKVASAILAGAIALGVSLQSPVNAAGGELSSKDRAALFTRYRQLIDAENTHNINLVRPFVWSSPSMLFVAKTKTAAEGNWGAFGELKSSSIISASSTLVRSTLVRIIRARKWLR
jgi:hypothetical protein